MVFPTLVRGGSLTILPSFNAVTVMRVIEQYKINCILMVPTMIASLLDHPEFGRHDLGSLEVIYYGASPIAPSRLREGLKKLGKVFFQFYGQTESPLTVTVMRRDEHDI